MAHKIYIGNLSFKAREGDLEGLLQACGPLVSVKIIKDRDSGRSKGFGFAEFESAESVERAIQELNGKDFQGRNLRVNEAQDKPPRR